MSCIKWHIQVEDKQVDKAHFSCKELAELKLPGKPTTRQGWGALVNAEHWEFIELSSRGRNGRTRTYKPSAEVMRLIYNKQESADVVVEGPSHLVSEPLNQAYSEPLGYLHPENDNNNDVVYVDQYPEGDGGTRVPPDEQLVVRVGFNRRQLRQQTGVSSENLVIITVLGDNMEPVLAHGDHIFVDRSCTRFIENAIYVIQHGDYLRIKRVQLRLDGSIVVKSDNDVYFPMETYSADEAQHFRIFGRVIPIKVGRFKI